MDIQAYSATYNELAKKIFYTIAKVKMGENLVLSPMSIIMLLGIAADAVQGKAREEITDIIGMNSMMIAFVRFVIFLVPLLN